MQRIAEKLEFMKERAVKVCAKARIGRKVGHKKRVFVQIFRKIVSKSKFLIVQIISVSSLMSYGEIMFCKRVNGKSQLKASNLRAGGML